VESKTNAAPFELEIAAPNELGVAVLPVAKETSFYRPELDCLRFFAFLAVFVHHTLPKTADFYQAHHLPTFLANVPYAGAYGVDLFFCLSAYLITELLLREKDQAGHLDVKAFYIRRMLRIWPLYFAFVLFAYGISFIDLSQHFSTAQLAMFLLLSGNWAAINEIHSFVAPLWSVSIEEQFYLLWPLVVRRASRRQMLGISFLMIAIAFVWRAVIQARLKSPGGIIWVGTFSHLDSISYGIILSLVGVRERTPMWMRAGLMILGLSAWVFAADIRERGDAMMALVALGSVAILRSAVGLKLNNRILVRLGIVSYGLYVYHEFCRDQVNHILPNTHGWEFVLWWVLSLTTTMIAALASYRWLESPFLRLKERFAVVKSRPV
jgi:peptidoglycan/LPS O-acetylase OafA/YrhL